MLSKYTNYPLPWIQKYVSIQSPAVYLSMAHLCGSQRMAPGPEASASPGNLLDLHIVRPTPDLLNQNYWRWSPVTNVWPHSGDPNVCSNLRTTGIFQLRFTFFFSSCPHSRHHPPPPRHFLLTSHSYNRCTNLNGEDEFWTNIFKTVHDRRNIPIQGDFIKIYVGRSVGWYL